MPRSASLALPALPSWDTPSPRKASGHSHLRSRSSETFLPPPLAKGSARSFPGLVTFSRHFVPCCAALLQPLYAVLGADHPKEARAAPLEWTPAAERAFAEVKQALADAVLLHHPRPDAETALFVNASTAAVGAVLQQRRPFVLYTGHKPLMFALRSASGNYSRRETCHKCCLLEFTTDVRHVAGEDNAAADALSRPDVNALHPPPAVDLDGIAQALQADQELADLRSSPASTTFREMSLPGSTARLWCDTSTGTPRPFVPLDFRRPVFNALHSLSHPGVRGTQKIVAERYIWPRMNANVRAWARACLACQRSKIHRHTISPPSRFLPPDARFGQVNIDLVGQLHPAKGYRILLSCIDRFTRWPKVTPIPDQQKQWPTHSSSPGFPDSAPRPLSPRTEDASLNRSSSVTCAAPSEPITSEPRPTIRLPTAWSSAFIGSSRLPSAPLTTATQHGPSVFPSSCLAFAP
ncbi:uncharacterized protein LOC135392395 [Ornithodoros turicata]|uniref:uncharacterized protein LOC135392395 n=1 Tax=Ornithodoros turicata TaxID=34597 RepID=UPI00313A3B72